MQRVVGQLVPAQRGLGAAVRAQRGRDADRGGVRALREERCAGGVVGEVRVRGQGAGVRRATGRAGRRGHRGRHRRGGPELGDLGEEDGLVGRQVVAEPRRRGGRMPGGGLAALHGERQRVVRPAAEQQLAGAAEPDGLGAVAHRTRLAVVHPGPGEHRLGATAPGEQAGAGVVVVPLPARVLGLRGEPAGVGEPEVVLVHQRLVPAATAGAAGGGRGPWRRTGHGGGRWLARGGDPQEGYAEPDGGADPPGQPDGLRGGGGRPAGSGRLDGHRGVPGGGEPGGPRVAVGRRAQVEAVVRWVHGVQHCGVADLEQLQARVPGQRGRRPVLQPARCGGGHRRAAQLGLEVAEGLGALGLRQLVQVDPVLPVQPAALAGLPEAVGGEPGVPEPQEGVAQDQGRFLDAQAGPADQCLHGADRVADPVGPLARARLDVEQQQRGEVSGPAGRAAPGEAHPVEGGEVREQGGPALLAQAVVEVGQVLVAARRAVLQPAVRDEPGEVGVAAGAVRRRSGRERRPQVGAGGADVGRQEAGQHAAQREVGVPDPDRPLFVRQVGGGQLGARVVAADQRGVLQVDAEVAQQVRREVGVALGGLVEEQPGGPLGRTPGAPPHDGVVVQPLPPVTECLGALPGGGAPAVLGRGGRVVGVVQRQQVRVESGQVHGEAAAGAMVGGSREEAGVGEQVTGLGLPVVGGGRGGQPEPAGEQQGLEGALVGAADVAQRAGVPAGQGRALGRGEAVDAVVQPQRLLGGAVQPAARDGHRVSAGVGALVAELESGGGRDDVVRVVEVRLRLDEFDLDVVRPVAQCQGRAVLRCGALARPAVGEQDPAAPAAPQRDAPVAALGLRRVGELPVGYGPAGVEGVRPGPVDQQGAGPAHGVALRAAERLPGGVGQREAVAHRDEAALTDGDGGGQVRYEAGQRGVGGVLRRAEHP